MSFILDALKKVEKRKTGTGEMRVAEEVLGRRRMVRYAGTATLVGIALVSALITAGTMRYFDRGGTSAGAGAGAGAGQSPKPSEATVPPSDASAEIERAVETRGPEPVTLEPSPPPRSRPAAGGAEPARVEASRTSGETALRSAEPPELRSEPWPEPEPSRDDGQAGEGEGVELLLQGTSVLNGEPVAVINDQRVFVGDRVGGAVVISIEAGRVVLEREGEKLELVL